MGSRLYTLKEASRVVKDSDLLWEQDDVDETSAMAKRSNSGRGAVSDSLNVVLAVFIYIKKKEEKKNCRAEHFSEARLQY